ncbi:duodenase-1-like [Poeciliopsis prolifica]|uniref:duodenase-1-like n=1 Tax=Poeciliopsis prolifica TaxID=188132 RepID=UPI0024130564|nr:duodenase-1-like [Poeciliopsis prolifica]
MHGLGTLLLFHIVTSLGQNVHGSDIIHGERAPENSMQYMVSVQNRNGHVCGGFLVSEDFVVTAAHCAIDEPVRVVVGTHKLSNSNMSPMNIEYVCKYPTYESVDLGDDIMLLKVSRYINTNNMHLSFCTSILNPQLCREKWWNGFPCNVICAGGYNTDKGFCQGDSGGPLVCNGVAVGIVSFNKLNNCTYPDVPNVYTDISKYLQWINNIMKTKKCVS